MNCEDLLAHLEQTLIREREPGWSLEATEHAKQCPACAARLGQLERLERGLAQLPGVEPSADFAQRVMSRIADSERLEAAPRNVNAWERPRDVAVLVAGLVLACSYLWPMERQSWLSNLWNWSGAIPWVARSASLSQYLSHHPPWAILLAALASTWLIAVVLLEIGRPREGEEAS
jgi:hypothetical protein